MEPTPAARTDKPPVLSLQTLPSRCPDPENTCDVAPRSASVSTLHHHSVDWSPQPTNHTPHVIAHTILGDSHQHTGHFGGRDLKHPWPPRLSNTKQWSAGTPRGRVGTGARSVRNHRRRCARSPTAPGTPRAQNARSRKARPPGNARTQALETGHPRTGPTAPGSRAVNSSSLTPRRSPASPAAVQVTQRQPRSPEPVSGGTWTAPPARAAALPAQRQLADPPLGRVTQRGDQRAPAVPTSQTQTTQAAQALRPRSAENGPRRPGRPRTSELRTGARGAVSPPVPVPPERRELPQGRPCWDRLQQ